MSENRVKSTDPFLSEYEPSDLQIASEFLTTWLPFLSRDLCSDCTRTLTARIRSINPELDSASGSSKEVAVDDDVDNCDANSLGSWKDAADISEQVEVSSPRVSWADMAAEEDGFGDEEEDGAARRRMVCVDGSTGGLKISRVVGEEKPKLSSEQRESIRFTNVERKKDFVCLERVGGKPVNVLEGLELHKGVFSAAEQRRIVELVYELQEMGSKGELKERTYTAPEKWMRGKGRVTLQFGCCYNYATDKYGNPPGILQNAAIDPIPHLFKGMIKRMVKWHVLPPTCVPDSCIVNIYDEGDCIPPHIDNHDFVRPFCTVSFLSECNILFGTNLKILAPGEFAGSVGIPLPVGSVLVLNGNGANVAKHCVPAVPTKRISITFRRMDESKRPVGYVTEPDLQGIEPLSYEVETPKRSTASRYEIESPTSWQPGRRGGYNSRGRGFTEGYNSSGGRGFSDGYNSSRGRGFSDGYNSSRGRGFSDGYKSSGGRGFSEGYNSSRGRGSSDGYNSRGRGFSDGYNSRGRGFSGRRDTRPDPRMSNWSRGGGRRSRVNLDMDS